MISIHAAREGGDVLAHHMPSVLSISIHAAREGGDPSEKEIDGFAKLFQSTPPVKAATNEADCSDAPSNISIHAAREGGDQILHGVQRH